ncbi:MAG TPA: type II secretion system protein [Verrucomicrobiota bacterium]|nr:type II secretion system protein [Verrucomicrobiota bacterium]HNU52376.1 type II secretion system protein [Verrucomicrobiota bacterium]
MRLKTPVNQLWRRVAPRVAGGFALLELLIVIGLIGVLTALLLPALSASKAKAQGLYCLKNLKQLQIAWAMYADEHSDYLPGVIGGSMPGPGVWVSGWLDFSSSPDNTNSLYLTDRRFSQLAYYDVPAKIFRCPADRSSVRIQGRVHDRVRSVSMNCWMNYVGNVDIGQERYRVFRKASDIIDPPPEKAWVFMDEREDSINDPLFVTNLRLRGKLAKIVDYPASYHNRAAGIAFADGHAQIKRWRDRRTTPVLRSSQLIELDVPSPDNPDVAWLQDRSSSLKQD